MTGILLRKIKSFSAIPLATKLLFAEAVFTSAYVKITLLFLPFSKVTQWLGATQTIPAATGETPLKLNLVKKISFAVKLCDRYAPWPTECYTRSLTAKIMLKRRMVSSTLYFGLRKDNNKLKGHAWLQCSGITVTGFCDFSKYQVHSCFS